MNRIALVSAALFLAMAILPACGSSPGLNAGSRHQANVPAPAADLKDMNSGLQGIKLALSPHGPPDGEFNLVNNLAVTAMIGDAPTLAWTERLAGDGDNNGVVNISDITPVGMYLNQKAHGFSPVTDADYDRNGEVNINDLAVLGQQWQSSLAGYAILSGPNPSALTELTRFGRSELFADPKPSDGVLTWEWTGEAITERTYFAVQPYDNQGTLGEVCAGTAMAEPGVQPANTAPVIELGPFAGPNPVTLPATTGLSVVAWDADRSPAPLSYTWEQLDGPGVTHFMPNGTADAGTTTATITMAGVYHYEVTISDGADSTSAQLEVTVNVQTTADGIIPADRRVDWDPGIPGGIPDYPAGVNVVSDHGAVGDGVTDDTDAFVASIDAAEEGTAVIIPAGTYRIKDELLIDKGICLRGMGHGQTTLAFDTEGNGNLIYIRGIWPSNGWIPVTSGFTRESTEITVEDATGVEAGDIIELQQDNDYDVYHQGDGTSWLAENIHGQMFEVTAVSGNTLTLNHPLYYTYNPAMNPRFVNRRITTGAGVEDLSIDRANYASSGSNIALVSSAYCWVRNVDSKMGATNHIGVSRCLGCEFRGCYFDDAWVDGGGGQGYGTSIGNHSTDCLIEDNIFRQLRHSMIIQVGSSGNVFGYNYSREPDRSDVSPDYPSPDICVHGHYGNMNLFEGNTVAFAGIDNYWGTNGPTTLFRNRMEKLLLPGDKANSYLSIQPNNHYHNIVGNEFGTADPESHATKPVNIAAEVIGTTILHGNYTYQDLSLEWDPAIESHNMADSYYLKGKPGFFGDTPWPPIGGDLSPNTNKIPAQQRWDSGELIPAD